jgi:hypothetical protein
MLPDTILNCIKTTFENIATCLIGQLLQHHPYLYLFLFQSVYQVEVSKVFIKNLDIFFLFPSKQFLSLSLKIQLLVILCNI